MRKKQPVNIPDATLRNWQEIVDLLAGVLQIPAALIMRLHEPHIEALCASRSQGNPYHPGEKEHFHDSGLYCETVIKTRKKLLVPNALADEKWKNNPDLKLNMISYLGFPIMLPNQEPFGTICVLDHKPNGYSETIELLMGKFKTSIESNLELIYMNQVLGDQNKALSDYLMEIQALRGLVSICSGCKSIRNPEGAWVPVEQFLIKHPQADFTHGVCPKCLKKLYPDFADEEP